MRADQRRPASQAGSRRAPSSSGGSSVRGANQNAPHRTTSPNGTSKQQVSEIRTRLRNGTDKCS
eukprot:2287340-Amphidinium_carterae.1